MKKHFLRELMTTKEKNVDFDNSTECQICGNDYIDNDGKVRDHCLITQKYRGSVHKSQNSCCISQTKKS